MNMAPFKENDEVLCVDEVPGIVKGATYKIKMCWMNGGEWWVELKDFINKATYKAKRFKIKE